MAVSSPGSLVVTVIILEKGIILERGKCLNDPQTSHTPCYVGLSVHEFSKQLEASLLSINIPQQLPCTLVDHVRRLTSTLIDLVAQNGLDDWVNQRPVSSVIWATLW